MNLYLRDKFQASSISLTSFRQGGGGIPPPPPQNEPLKSLPRLGLMSAITLCKICKINIFSIGKESYESTLILA